ncbi:MAG: cell division protein FtsQ/DivIB [Lachnospiraceae bacterium]
MTEKKEADKREGVPSGLMIALLAVLFLAAVLVWGYNLSRLKTIEYEGLTRYTEQEFTKLLSSSAVTQNTYGFFLKHSLFPRTDIPFIEEYDVTVVNSKAVRVQVYEKLVTGCVEIMGKYMYFDKDGIVVESSAERLNGVPLIVGLKFDEIVLYEKLHVQKQSLFTKILDITKLLLQYDIPAETIIFDSNYEVTLVCGDIKVLLGKKDMYDLQLSALQGILAAAKGRSGTLDMRSYSKENQDVILK